MTDRPKLNIELTRSDRMLELTTIAILVLLWVGTIAGFSKLPDQIPSHFNGAGQADDYSYKTSIFVLPIIATILYAGITLLNKYPHLYNYLQTVTIENARQLYTSASRLIRILKFVVVVIFAAIVLLTYRSAFSIGSGLTPWFLPVALCLLLAPNIFYLVKFFFQNPTGDNNQGQTRKLFYSEHLILKVG